MVVKAYAKYVLRDSKYLLGKLIAIIFIVALGVAFLIGLLTTAPNLRNSIEEYYIQSNVSDLLIQADSIINPTDLDKLKDNKYVEEIMPFFYIEENIDIYGTPHRSRITLLDFEKGVKLNELNLIEGRLPNKDGDNIEVVVEQSKGYITEIPVGYKTQYKNQTFEVVGIVKHPWYFTYGQEISPNTQHLIDAVVYTDASFLPYSVYTNVAVKLNLKADNSYFSEEYKKEVDDIKNILDEEFPNFYFSSLKQNASFSRFESDVKIVEIIATIFPAFFFLITILVSMSSITRIISDQRRQIGILRSFGFSKMKIAMKYIIYALMASGIGSLIGIAGGIYLIPKVIYNAYLNSYKLPQLIINFHFPYITLITLLMIGCVLLITLFGLIGVLKDKPNELLTYKTPKPGKQIFLEKVKFIWDKIKFKHKSTFRNLSRHKRNTILTIIGVAGSSALLLAGLGIKNSIDKAGEFQYQEMMNYDLEIGVEDPYEENDLLKGYDKIYVKENIIKYNEEEYLNVLVLENTLEVNDFLLFKNTKSEKIEFNEKSVILTKAFADRNEFVEGDIFKIEMDDIIYNFRITDIAQYYFGNNVYINQDLFEKVEFNKVLYQTNLSEKDQKDLVPLLKEDQNIILILAKNDLELIFQRTSESINSVVVILVLAAMILAIIINYNLAIINISSREREMATLKVIGYQENEVRGYIFRETAILTTVGIIAGLLLGYFLHSFIISKIVLDSAIFPLYINWSSYLITVGLSYVFLFLVNIITMPKIKKINMIDALKSYE